jgi:hypothetical protein
MTLPKVKMLISFVVLLGIGLLGCAGARPLSEQPAPEILATNVKAFTDVHQKITCAWNPVANAEFYKIEIDCLHCCDYGKWCNELGKSFTAPVKVEKATTYELQLIGQQSHRWRVWGVDVNGREGPKSAWWEVTYSK